MNEIVERRLMNFQEFGVRFVHVALTADRLKGRMASMIGPIPEISQPAMGPPPVGLVTVNGAMTSVDVTDLTPNDLQLSAAYDVRLGIRLHVHLNMFEVTADWEGTFAIPVQMTVLAYTPLELELTYRPVVPADIGTVLSGMNWLAAIPALSQMVQDQIVLKLAEQVNQQMDAALPTRRIDIAKALAALDVPEDPTVKPDPNTAIVKKLSLDRDHPTMLLPGEKIEGDLPLEQRAWMSINIDPTTITHLTIAARLGEVTNVGALLYYKMLDQDGIVLDSGSTSTVYDSQDFVAINTRFYHAQYKGLAFIVLQTTSTPLQIRGKLSYVQRP